MINEKGQRELCYVVEVNDIRPIEGKDRVECAIVNGWTIMVRKGQFNPGDLGIYFEIDSKVPSTTPFKFLEPKKYHIKTQKYGAFYSQGLLMHPSDFGWSIRKDNCDKNIIVDDKGQEHNLFDQSRFLTQQLEVTYYVVEDNERKAQTVDKYKRMAARHGRLFAKPFYRWLMRREWGRKLLYIFYGKKKDNPNKFPTCFPYIKVTDQERVENMPWVLENKTPFIVTQKCDGSSATYILARRHKFFGEKFEYYVCSRNVRQSDEKQECYHDENYYWEASHKYHIREALEDILNQNPEMDYVCIQGELCGPKIQGNPHGLKELHLFAFHMIDSIRGKYDIRYAKKVWDEYGIESVPIICDDYILPDDMEEFKLSADGKYDSSVCEGQTDKAREGFVYYDRVNPNFSFKNVSRKYLLKH